MVAVAFLALVILALVNIAFWWVMRIRLMRMDSASLLDTESIRAILEAQHKVVDVPHHIGFTP
jgi:hypothetical protein